MKRIIIYGIFLSVLVIFLKVLEYKYFVRDLTAEIYIGTIAIFFTAFGIWAGTKMISRKYITVPVAAPFELDEVKLQDTGLSNREYEVLELMAAGCSNQEIAEKLFISMSTVKTHAANLFIKLNVKRRTQAVKRAKELQLLP